MKTLQNLSGNKPWAITLAAVSEKKKHNLCGKKPLTNKNQFLSCMEPIVIPIRICASRAEKKSLSIRLREFPL